MVPQAQHKPMVDRIVTLLGDLVNRRGPAPQTERSESRGGDGALVHKWISHARAYRKARSEAM